MSRSATRAGVAAHVSAVAVVLLATVAAGRPVIWAGMLAFAGPLAVALIERHGDAFARAHARAALAFNASLAIYLLAIVGVLHLTTGSPYTVQLVPFLLFMNMLLAFNWLAFTAIGIHRAANGQTFTYPMTLRRLG